MNLLSLNTQDIGIDLGTSNVVITIKERGIVLREKSVVAVNQENGEIIAAGDEAKEILKKAPEKIFPIYPIKNGTITDIDATVLMIKNMLSKVTKKYNLGKPRIIASCPATITEVEKSALINTFLQNGAREVYLLEEPMASAIGIGLNVLEPSSNAVVNIGAGITESAVISCGAIIKKTSIKIGSKKMNADIIEFLKKTANIVIDEETANELKENLGAAQRLVSERQVKIDARNINTGLPQEIEISSKEIESAIRETIEIILETITESISSLPPEIAQDILKNGIYLCGGGALIKNLDNLVSQTLEINTYIVDKPMDAVANGLLKVLNDFKKYKEILII